MRFIPFTEIRLGYFVYLPDKNRETDAWQKLTEKGCSTVSLFLMETKEIKMSAWTREVVITTLDILI